MDRNRRTPLEFAALVRRIINMAPRHGADVVEALDRKDLLSTPAREREIRVETLRTLWREWDRWQPHELMRRKFHAGAQNSPADMYHVLMEFLAEYIEHERKKEW